MGNLAIDLTASPLFFPGIQLGIFFITLMASLFNAAQTPFTTLIAEIEPFLLITN